VGHPITHQWPPLAQVGSMSDIIDITGQRFRSPDCCCMFRTTQARQDHLDLPLRLRE
jgi:hypothetical protein